MQVVESAWWGATSVFVVPFEISFNCSISLAVRTWLYDFRKSINKCKRQIELLQDKSDLSFIKIVDGWKMLGDTMVSDTISLNIKFLRINLKSVKVK